jgi:hypothetical protein
MGEHEVYEYSLNSGQNEQILKMTTFDKYICFILENKNEQKFTAYVTLNQLKEVCKAFNTIKTLNELLIILHSNIEAQNITLLEDDQDTSIELKFTIKLASGNFPPFSINLELEDDNSLKGKNEERNILPAKFDYRGNVEAEKKYGKTTQNTTEYNKPIVQPNYKKPIVQLEYIEPILQVHYPDGTIKSKTLPARIQTVDGQIPDIDETQFKRIQEEMNRHMANQEGSKYSSRTVVVNDNNENILASIADAADKDENNNEGGKAFKSKYSTFSVPAKPIVYPEQKVIKQDNNQKKYTYYTQKNNIIEYAPNIINQNEYNKNINYYTQSNLNNNYDYLFNQGISYNTNYENNNNYSNYSNILSSSYQNSYYTENNSYEFNNLLNQNQYQSIQYQPQNYQYQNNYYSSSYPQSFPQQFEQAFAEVIPLNPIQEYLQSQMKTESQTQQEEKQEVQNEENNEEENEIIENKGEIEDDGEEGEQEEEQNQNVQNDVEQVFRTEEGLIIFRNGILKSIIQKYAEIDNVVTRIQDILLKGAKFNLLYKATMHGDKASVFHEKCDNQPRSLVIVETDKGVRFGGFTTKSWEGHCAKKIDNDAFVFSVDKNKIFDIVINEPAVGAFPKFGPVFFGCQIRIYNDFFTKGGSTCFRGLNYKTTQDFELNNGEQKYIVKDIEVYGIETTDV